MFCLHVFTVLVRAVWFPESWKQSTNDKYRKCKLLFQNIKLLHSTVDTCKASYVTQAFNISFYLQLFALKDSQVVTDFLIPQCSINYCVTRSWLPRIHWNNFPVPSNHQKGKSAFITHLGGSLLRDWLQIRSLSLVTVRVAMITWGIKKE